VKNIFRGIYYSKALISDTYRERRAILIKRKKDHCIVCFFSRKERKSTLFEWQEWRLQGLEKRIRQGT
jgi:hypothetical protein